MVPPCGKCHAGQTANVRGSVRKSRHQRGYDSRWVAVRERVLNDDPLCVDCEAVGRTTPAQDVHHVQTISGAPHRRLDRTNLVPLCQQCHDARHGGQPQRSRERDYG